MGIQAIHIREDDAPTFTEGRVPDVRTVTYDLGYEGAVTLPLYYVMHDDELPHLERWLNSRQRYLLDTETSGLDPLTDRVATIQFGSPLGSDPRLYVVDVRCLTREVLTAFLWRQLPKRGVKKLGMNIGFECRFITAGFDVPIRDVECIQIAEQTIRAGLFGDAKAGDAGDGERANRVNRAAYKHTSMAKLSMFYLGITLDKDFALRTGFFKTPPGQHNLRQLTYAAGDCVYPAYIAKRQRKELDARDLHSTVRTEWAVIPVLAEAQLHGMHIDQDAWRTLWQESVTELDKAQRALDALFLSVQGDLFGGTEADVRPVYLGGKKVVPLNYGSSDHVPWLIKTYCRAIGWPIQIITTWGDLAKAKAKYARAWVLSQASKGRKVTEKDVPDYVLDEKQYCVLLDTQRDNLTVAKCLGQLPADLVDLLAAYSKYKKRESTYGISFLQKNVRPDTKRMHVEFHQYVTATGRVSSEPNSQNFPKDPRFRACFKAQAGKKFCIADYSQVEPRITALCSQDPVYTNTYLTNDDLYLAVAQACLGERPDKTTPEGALARERFKQMVLSLAYRMGKAKFRRKMILALADQIMAGTMPVPTFFEISELFDHFFAVHDKLHAYQEDMSSKAAPMVRVGQDMHVNTRRLWDTFLKASVTWIQAPCGRKRFFPPDANPYSEAPNFPPQGGSATMLKAAMALIQREIDDRGWWKRAWLSNNIHDELVYEVDEEIAQEFAYLLKAKMEEAGNFFNGNIPIIAEFPENSTGVLDLWAKKLPKAA